MSITHKLATDGRTERYDLLGVTLDLRSQANCVLDGFAETFCHFRSDQHTRPAELTLNVIEASGGLRLDDGSGSGAVHGGEAVILPALLERANQILSRQLANAGVVAVHAGAVTHPAGALIIAGPNNSGKSTLALGLVGTGMRLLSDELALIDKDASTVLPYRRSVHIRPGTPELVPMLSDLLTMPPRPHGGGISWSLSPERLEMALPGSLADPAPLREVLLLEPRISAEPALNAIDRGSAVVELLRGTPLVTAGLAVPLHRLSQALSRARCARLRPGELTRTLQMIRAWIEADERAL